MLQEICEGSVDERIGAEQLVCKSVESEGLVGQNCEKKNLVGISIEAKNLVCRSIESECLVGESKSEEFNEVCERVKEDGEVSVLITKNQSKQEEAEQK